jgi:hypothetical protein
MGGLLLTASSLQDVSKSNFKLTTGINLSTSLSSSVLCVQRFDADLS